MEAVLLASMLSCADGAWILSGLRDAPLRDVERRELRLEIVGSMPDTCSPEQYNPTGRK